MKDKIISVILHPFVISIFITIPVILFLPDFFSKYKVELDNQGLLVGENEIVYFFDLNGDSISEKIVCKKNLGGNAAFKILNLEDNLINQWNLHGEFPNSSYQVWFHDFNKNGYAEVYCITQNDDSAFLQIIEPLKEDGFTLTSRFITKINKQDGKSDFSIGSFLLEDIDLDGADEVIFSINAGFSISPRKVFVYKLISDTIISSPFLGNITIIVNIQNINKDKYPELVLTTYSTGNISEESNYPLHDNSSYLIILDYNLNYLFDPVELHGTFSELVVYPLKIGGSYYLIGLLNNKSAQNYTDKLLLFDSVGNILNKRELPEGSFSLFVNANNINSNIILFNKKTGTLEFINNLLQTYSRIQFTENSYLFKFDIDNDGENEWIIVPTKNQAATISRFDFKSPTKLQIPINGRIRNTIQIIKNKRNSVQIFIQIGDNWFTYKYLKNTMFYFKYPIYVGIYLVVLALLILINKSQKIRIERKLATEKQIFELQIKTIRNQVDPHFVFNAINTISEMMLTDDKVEADKFICNFSDFMRKTLLSADKISHTLKEEIEYVENFIQLQKIRYNNSFDYQIEIEENTNLQTTVPKHVLFSYVENAIKHGLSKKTGSGFLKIFAGIQNSNLYLSVEDNGIGLDKSKILESSSTGNGLPIMEKIYELYSKIYEKKKITHNLIEIFDNKNNKSGVRVEIHILK